MHLRKTRRFHTHHEKWCVGFLQLRVVGTTLRCAVWVLIAVASPVVDHRLDGAWTPAVVTCRLSRCSLRVLEHGLSSCGAQAELLQGMWDLPRQGIKPMSPALAGRFLTTGPPKKYQYQPFQTVWLPTGYSRIWRS